MGIYSLLSRMRPTEAYRAFVASIWVLVLGLLLQAALWLNPGYFSHDELQWAAAARSLPLPWVSWTDLTAFQFRPLTFNLWLLLSHALFESPRLFHATFVLFGSANAMLLFLALDKAFGRCAAVMGSLAFLASPYVAYVHGWVATLADLLWVGFALIIMICAQQLPADRSRQRLLLAGSTVLLTAAALLAKEAAVVIPALLMLGWLMQRRSQWLIAALGALPIVVLYFVVRLPAIAAGAGEAGSFYAWSITAVPWRVAEYLLYPWLPNRFEPVNLLHASGGRIALAVLLAVLFLGGLATTSRRLLAGFLLGGLLVLAPVLVLQVSSAQYGYGFAAVIAAAVAGVWQSGPRIGKLMLGLPLLAMVLHGAGVQRQMVLAGAFQQRFHADLVELLQPRPLDAPPLSLWPRPGQRWLIQRLIHDVPSYRAIPLLGRVRLAATMEEADYSVSSQGDLISRDVAPAEDGL